MRLILCAIQDVYLHCVISGDQWNSFFEFSMTMDEKFTQFDEDAAWPCLLDEFVDWCKSLPS